MTSQEEWYEKYWKNEEAADKYVDRIDALLKLHTRESQKKICELYEEEKFTQIYMVCNLKLVCGQILVNIARNEELMDRPQRYIDRFCSLEQYMREWDDLKFLLWEMEFLNSPEAEENFYSFVMENGISDVTIGYLLLSSAFEKERMILKVVNLMISREKVLMSYLLLHHGCEICPESRQIAQLCTRLKEIVEGG